MTNLPESLPAGSFALLQRNSLLDLRLRRDFVGRVSLSFQGANRALRSANGFPGTASSVELGRQIRVKRPMYEVQVCDAIGDYLTRLDRVYPFYPE